MEGNLSWVRFSGFLGAWGHIVTKAGTGIEAGWGIKAGEGIKAGWGIKCNLTLKFAYRLFAGVATFKNKRDEEADIICGKLDGGKVCYGKVKKSLKTKWYWHVHHETLVEILSEPIKNRIDYIKNNKPEKETKTRLRLLKPIKAKKIPETHDEWEELHTKECPKCPWNGKTIFSEGGE